MFESLFRPQWRWMLLRYALGLLVGILAAGARHALIPVMGMQAPYTLLFAAVVIVAVTLGTGPGLLTALVGIWAGETFLLEPYGTWQLTWASVLRISFVLLGTLFVGYTGHRLRHARQQALDLAMEQSRAKEEWERTFDAVPDLIAIIDRDHKILRANEAMALKLGLSAEACVGKACYVCVHGTDAPPAACPHQQLLADGQPHTVEFHEPRLGGDFLITCTPLRDAQGRMLGSVHVAHNITERKKAEEALRESEATLRSIIEQMPAGVTVRDAQSGALLLSNSRSREILGRLFDRPDEFERYHGRHPNGHPYCNKDWPLFRSLTTGEVVEGEEIDCQRADGSHFTMSVSSAPVRDTQGRVVIGVAVFQDITERRKAEQTLRETADELKRSNYDLEQFAYVASHDLQEPLRMVTGYLDLIHETYHGKLDQEADQFIGFAVDGAQRMQRLLNDLLAYSRVGTKGRQPQRADVEKLLAGVLDTQHTSIAMNDAVITHDPLPVVWADETQLTQVFSNLIANALKFRKDKEPPRIHVGAERRERVWLFSVKDNGIGLDMKFCDRIFQVFQRLHDQSKYPGSGIGLAICKKIVERHGGKVCLESEPGAGTTFYFTIPDREEQPQ